MPTIVKLIGALSLLFITACQTGNVSGNDAGSQPANADEANEMQKAVNRCHRTGGTRVVKIMGELKCF